MELKTYQIRILKELSDFLNHLSDARLERKRVLDALPDEVRADVAASKNFVKEAWQKCKDTPCREEKDGLGNFLPDVYLKVPTGGGKTFLACHAIDRIHREYLQRKTGLVLWIVPTTQIYRQTLGQLRDRAHPYRQLLEITSGGWIKIAERTDPIAPADMRDKLVILLLMLPAANRQSTEQLKMYQDSGGYDAFFPDEQNAAAHKKLSDTITNLESYKTDGGILPVVVKSSLANVFRLYNPLIIVDEGQKAYSDNARKTIRGFNPAFVLELSATPPQATNIIAVVGGRDLDNEEMIKLDINLINKNTPDWKMVLLEIMRQREQLEKQAMQYRQNSNRYIRPIALIQVERTGKDQRKMRHIHAEDAREYLLQNGIPAHQIAVKSSDKDDLEGIDLMSEECPIRFIITKQALQEGWDCAFAYLLAVLSNLTSPVSMTQLVGRVLRQPHARKTDIKALDECYVYTHRSNSGEVVGMIKKELEKEGLGDLHGNIRADTPETEKKEPVISEIRERFKKFKGKLYLPQFVVVRGKTMRPLEYESDILAHLDWESLKCDDAELEQINLGDAVANTAVAIGLPRSTAENLETDEWHGDLTEADPVVMTQQLIDVVPNPWYGFAMSKDILNFFNKQHGKRDTAENFVFVIEECKKILTRKRDKMAEDYFRLQVERKKFELVLFKGSGEWAIPGKIELPPQSRMNREDGNPIQKSLFDFVGDEEMNEYEKSVALYLDKQEKLLWWYRNQTHSGYKLLGWKRHKIAPDFIVATDDGAGNMGEVRVIETKGIHLKNEDTDYKKSVLELCDQLCRNAEKTKKTKWSKLCQHSVDHTFHFNLVFEDEWKNAFHKIFNRVK